MAFDFDALAFKERVKQATDVVELVSGYLRLVPAGRILKGHCPWHDDQRPSFQVDPHKQTVRCWVCNLGGDVFSFVMQTERLTFPEALEFLADRANIPLPKRSSPQSDVAFKARQNAYQVLQWAEQTFHQYLLEARAGEPARTYLLQRGFQPESLLEFRLGYAPPDGKWLLQRGALSSISAEDLELAGLVSKRPEGGGYYDCFRGRVIFPIRDPQGKTIAFGGRILPGTDHPAKYVNTAATALFDKKRTLYGLDAAAAAIRRAGHALVMEGYTDCLIARQHGLGECVAVLGTALGEAHVKLLRRYTDRVVLVLDGDRAGRARAEQVLGLFLSAQLDLRVLTLPGELDPCDYVLQYGVDSLKQLVTLAPDALEYRIQSAMEGVDVASGSFAANQALEKILGSLADCPTASPLNQSAQSVRLEQILARLSATFRVSDHTLRERLKALKQQQRKTGIVETNADDSASADGALVNAGMLTLATGPVDPVVKEMLELVLLDGSLAERLPRSILERELGQAADLVHAVCNLVDEGLPVTFEQLMLALQSGESQIFLIDLDAAARLKQQHSVNRTVHERWEELFASLERHAAKQRLSGDLAKLKENVVDESEQLAQMLRMRQEIQNRHGIAKPTDG